MSVDTVYASGFGTDWDGTYTLRYTDHWSNGDYWIFRDSLYWYISDSEYKYGDTYSKAKMEFNTYINPRGNYTGIGTEPDGVIL